MADKQLSRRISAYNDTNVAVIRIKGQIPRLGLTLSNIGTVGVLRTGAAAVAYDVAQTVIEGPVHKAGTVQAEGAIGPGG